MATIDQLQLDIIVNNKGTVARINSVNRALEKLNKTVAGSSNFSNILGGVGGGTSKVGGIAKSVSNISKSLDFGKILGKLYFIRNYTKQLGRGIANVVQLAMDYVETQNLWQVANRENIAGAKEFITLMNKAYGVSEKNLMNYQAIFKNMLSALGYLSDVVSTTLSEQLTQFALDFASLYNVSIESAMQKFQAVLSGQVRPIRSVSGYDITETTIFDIYKQMGGEKSMRQLSQIEKRLLRIYAVFDQMSATGAVGDMAKTIETAANQSRIMNEQWQEMTMWLGQSLLMWLNQAKILQTVNASLITMKEIFKALAYAGGYAEENFIDGIFESTTEANEAVDELTGKLLSFDKFEALNQAEQGTGIDPKIEQLLASITTQTELANLEAQSIAESWLSALGFVDENQDGVYELTQKAKDLLDTVKSIGIALGVIIGLSVINKITSLISTVSKLTFSFKSLNLVLMAGAIYEIIKAVEAFKNGDTWGGILATTIGVGLVGAFVLLNKQMFITIGTKIVAWFQTLRLQGALATTVMDKFRLTMSYVGIAVTSAFAGFMIFDTLLSSLDPDTRKIVSILGLIVAALTAVTIAAIAAQGALTLGVAIPIIAASVGVGIASIKGLISANTPAYATGGFPEDGMFYANSGELVGGFSNGRTAVANNEQIITGIKQGVYEAVIAANSQSRGGGMRGDVYIDRTKVGQIVESSVYGEGVRVGHFQKR